MDAVRADPRFGPIYQGDLAAYDGDHSKADLALAGAFARRGLPAGGIDLAMRTSGLFREKWERHDYRTNTIAKALQGVTHALGGQRDGYLGQPTKAEPPASASEQRDNFSSGTNLEEPRSLVRSAERHSGNLLDPANGKITISIQERLPRDYILDGHLLPGKSAVLAGFGGVSKTQLALQLAAAIVLGLPFMGKTIKPGKAIAILGEEDKGEVARRLSAIARRFMFENEQIRRLETDMLAFPLVGHDVRLTAPGQDRSLAETQFVKQIVAAANAMGEVRLIVVDHLALVHGGDHNAREDAALTMRVVNHIAQETGAAVLVLAHTPKGAIGKEESDASMVAGSTAFVDQARGAWVLATMREEEAKKLQVAAADRKNYVSLAIVKNNYGPTGEVIWFQRVAFDGIGLLEHVVLSPPATGAEAAVGLRAKIVALVAAHPGQHSKTGLRDTQSGKKDGVLKASKGEVQGAIESLLADGRLVNRVPSPEERKKFGHRQHVTVLDVGEA